MQKEIRATVKTSFQQQTNSGTVFYTFEYGETWENDFTNEQDYEIKKQKLWDVCNDEVTKQIISTKNLYKGVKQ